MQWRDAVRPVLHLTLRGYKHESEATTLGFRLEIRNAGIGPAFDVQVDLIDIRMEQTGWDQVTPPASPALLRVNEGIWFEFTRTVLATSHGWPGPGKENEVVGEILVTCLDSFNGPRSTRAALVATWHIAPTQPYSWSSRRRRSASRSHDDNNRNDSRGRGPITAGRAGWDRRGITRACGCWRGCSIAWSGGSRSARPTARRRSCRSTPASARTWSAGRAERPPRALV